VIRDPTNRDITTILSQCHLSGKETLENGCGKGRITRDLVKYVERVVASDPDVAALETAVPPVLLKTWNLCRRQREGLAATHTSGIRYPTIQDSRRM
jgi:2-polyprenyl-3-methyl-5-hydroxy-6-metoxy-1,4-benzoquinol methylase